MNIIAVDIGNTNITIGLFLRAREEFIASVPGDSHKKLAELLKAAWDKVPLVEGSKEKTKDAVIVASSVKPAWTKQLQKTVKAEFGEKIYIIGKDIPLPMLVAVDKPELVGTDRVVSAAAAYAVVEDAVVVADFGTAVTIDLVDAKGRFLGGVILPGFEIAAKALKENTAKLPEVKIKKPTTPFGKNTRQAINAGLYYSAIGGLEEIVRRYAEEIGKWPHTILTGRAAEVIKDDCEFVDSYVPYLVVKGIVLAYKRYIEAKAI